MNDHTIHSKLAKLIFELTVAACESGQDLASNAENDKKINDKVAEAERKLFRHVVGRNPKKIERDIINGNNY